MIQKISIIFLLLIIFSPLSPALAQDRDAYYFGSNIGKEISQAVAEKYDLFPGFPGFVSARFYPLLDGSYEVEIKYMEDGTAREQIWYITKQEFSENYLKKLNQSFVAGSLKHVDLKEQLICLQLTDHTSFRGKLLAVDKSALQLRDVNDPYGPGLQIPVSKIEQVSIFRRENPGKSLLIGLIPGAVIGLTGFFSGDDEPGILSFSNEEKAVLGFMFGGFIGLNIGGTIAAMRSVDFDIPLEGMNPEEKREVFNQIYGKRVPKRLHIRINPWFALHTWEANDMYGNDDRMIGYMPGIRARIYFTPRSGLELSYGQTSQFNRKISYSDYHYDPYYDEHPDLKQEITYFSGGYFIALSRNKLVNPVFSWGWGYYRDKNPDDYYDAEGNLALHFKIGLEHHFNRWISMDMRLGPVTNFDRLFLVGELGISLGKFY